MRYGALKLGCLFFWLCVKFYRLPFSIPVEIQLGIAVIALVFFQLPTDILLGLGAVDPDRANEVASGPEVLVGEHALSAEFVMEKNGRFAFQKAHDIGDTVTGRDGKDQVDMLGAGVAFNDLHVLLLCQLTDDLSRPLADVSVEDFLPVLGDDDDVVGAVPGDVRLMVESGSGHGKKRECLPPGALPPWIVLKRRNGGTSRGPPAEPAVF